MPRDFEIIIPEDGPIEFIYDDELAELLDIGESITFRASHVEPAGGGVWTADMTPILSTIPEDMRSEATIAFGGPLLGPFRFRKDALDAEVAWISKFLQGYSHVQTRNLLVQSAGS